jgi:hypothetical protein
VNSTGDGTRKHLRADACVSRTRRICPEERLIGLPTFRVEKIMHAARIRTARALFEEDPVSCRIPAMDRDHAVDERRDAFGARCLVVRRGPQHSQYLVEVPLTHGLDQSELVREVLIKRADADACDFGNSVGRETSPAALPQNVSRRVEDCIGYRPGARLPRLFPHRAHWRSNASSQDRLLRRNMSNMLAFVARVEAHVEMPVLLTEWKMVPKGQGETYRDCDLPLYLGARFLSEAAALAQSVAIGWTIYSLSNTPMALGVVGLVQFVPMILLTLPAGELCDRFSPRRVLAAGLALQSLCAVTFLVLAVSPYPALWPFYAVVLGFGAARAFTEPAGQALLPFLVPSERLPHAIAWSSSAWQIAIIAGPALGGLAYALGPAAAYGICGAGLLSAMLGVVALGGRRPDPPASATLKDRMTRMIEGLAFVRCQPVVLGAISLDLFAVLLGGATILLPVYARDILHAGPTGLGLMRSAPAVGACLVALIQASHPPDRRVGLKLFAAVAVFGITTLIFAFSTSLALSLAALFVLGASDMVSVNIRSSLVQLTTPDAMRGRVSAINMLFIGASSELGAFESGVAAAIVGTVPAVALGGLGTLLVAVIWMKAFPALRRADRLSRMRRSDNAV